MPEQTWDARERSPEDGEPMALPAHAHQTWRMASYEPPAPPAPKKKPARFKHDHRWLAALRRL